MAEVNAKMVVSSNYAVAITPMFVEGAAAVNVDAGDNNMPFSYVDWKALQSDVVDGGATFMIQKMAMGANQEMEPTGDVAYVTCGPFECVSGDTAPAITSMDDDSYVAWDPMLDVSYGWVDNDVFDNDADDERRPDRRRRDRPRLGHQFDSGHGRQAHLQRRSRRSELQRDGSGCRTKRRQDRQGHGARRDTWKPTDADRGDERRGIRRSRSTPWRWPRATPLTGDRPPRALRFHGSTGTGNDGQKVSVGRASASRSMPSRIGSAVTALSSLRRTTASPGARSTGWDDLEYDSRDLRGRRRGDGHLRAVRGRSGPGPRGRLGDRRLRHQGN